MVLSPTAQSHMREFTLGPLSESRSAPYILCYSVSGIGLVFMQLVLTCAYILAYIVLSLF